MGYTHYIRSTGGFSDEKWEAFKEEVKLVMERAEKRGIKITGDGCGEQIEPVDFNKDEIRFNGVGDESHETCVIYKKPFEFEFCKTQRTPYDAVVVAVYYLAQKYGNYVKISSDGGENVFNSPILLELPNESEEDDERISGFTKIFKKKE